MPWIQPFTTPIFPSAPMSFKLSLLFRISGYNFVRISHIYYACYMSQPSHPPLFITLIIFSGQYNLWSSSAPKCPDHLYSPPSFLFKGHRCSFLGVKRSECKVYHLLHLVTRLGISGAIPLLPLCVYMMWTGQLHVVELITQPCYHLTSTMLSEEEILQHSLPAYTFLSAQLPLSLI
jgi:hypothetical protein